MGSPPESLFPDDSEPVALSGVYAVEKSGDQRLVYGWSSVAKIGDETVTDLQGDQLDVYDLEKASHRFVSESRVMNELHAGPQVATLVSSIVFTPEVIKALGLPSDFKQGWFTAWRVNDDDVWAKVKSGEYSGMSIEGRATRREIA
jgi:hypothetical protein